jgi:hypothetical protein
MAREQNLYDSVHRFHSHALLLNGPKPLLVQGNGLSYYVILLNPVDRMFCSTNDARKCISVIGDIWYFKNTK